LDHFARIFPRDQEEEDKDEMFPPEEDKEDCQPSDKENEPSASQCTRCLSSASPPVQDLQSVGPLAPSRHCLAKQQLLLSKPDNLVSMRRVLRKKIAERLSARPECRQSTPRLNQPSGSRVLQGEFMFIKITPAMCRVPVQCHTSVYCIICSNVHRFNVMPSGLPLSSSVFCLFFDLTLSSRHGCASSPS
jgi:hypothetical protein